MSKENPDTVIILGINSLKRTVLCNERLEKVREILFNPITHLPYDPKSLKRTTLHDIYVPREIILEVVSEEKKPDRVFL